MKRIIFLISVLIVSTFTSTIKAQVTMPQMFSDNMVLQRGKIIPIWGKAKPETTINIKFLKKKYNIKSDSIGHWNINLPSMKAGGPYTMQINNKTIKNIMIGDVWLCSGQSNMDITVGRVSPIYEKEISTYSNKDIRLFRVQTDINTHAPQWDIKKTQWNEVTPYTAWGFSAIGYFLAKKMYEETHVPQGIICNSLGGTPVQSWVCKDSLKKEFPTYYLQTELYDNNEYIVAQQEANNYANNRWNEILNREDPGIVNNWMSVSLDDSKWQTVNQFDNSKWAMSDGKGIIGSVWMRQHITIDAAHAGKKALLILGRLYDMDYTFVNGKEVGRTYYQYPPRRYEIPEGLLHEGDNVITVRFINKSGIPEFIKEKQYRMNFDNGDSILLSENWKTHKGEIMPSSTEASFATQYLPYVLYNAMLYPLHPYAISGVVWNQGESNSANPLEYGNLLKKMMDNWRTLWKDEKLPFVIVQLANFMAPSNKPQNSNWAELRQQQRLTALNDANAELAVAIDLGETTDIHPLKKKEITARIARGMEKMVYHKKITLSPEITDVKYERNKAIVTFNLQLKATDINELELAGNDNIYYNAKGKSTGNILIITSDKVDTPVKIRYAWKNNPIHANLYGVNGLPVSPFEY